MRGPGPRQMAGGQVPGGHRNYQNRPGGPMRQGNRGYNNQMNNNYKGAPPMHNQTPQVQNQHQMVNQMQVNPAMMNQQPVMAPQHQQPPQVNAQMSVEQRYLLSCQQIIYAVVPENPSYKEQVGTIFFDYIKHIAGPDKAPKVTGMLIDLPIDDIKMIMQDWSLLQTRVQ